MDGNVQRDSRADGFHVGVADGAGERSIAPGVVCVNKTAFVTKTVIGVGPDMIVEG